MPEKQNGQVVSFFKKIAEMLSGRKKQEKSQAPEETKTETSIIPAIPIKQSEKKVKQRWLPTETKKTKKKAKAEKKDQKQDLIKKIGKISTKATKALQKKIETEKKKILPESSDIEIKKAQRKIKRLEKKLLRREAAKKGARKRKRKHEEIMERLGAIESKVEPLKPLAEADKSLFVGEKATQKKAATETQEKQKKWPFNKILNKEKTEEKQTTTIQPEKKSKGIKIEFGKPLDKNKKDYSIMQAQQPETVEEKEQTKQVAAPTIEQTETAAPAMPAAEEGSTSLPEEIVLGEEKKQEEKELNIDDQIELTKRMISRTRYEFFKRMISEEEFKRRTSSLEEKLHLLQEKKKLLAEKKTQNQSQEQAQKPFFSTGNRTTVPAAPTGERKGIPFFFGTGKIAGPNQTIAQNTEGVDPKILESMEAKLQEISEKYNISEKAMVSNLKKFGTDRIIEDFDKLIRLIETEHEEKKKAAEEKKEEKMRFDSVSKAIVDKKKAGDKGVQKEIQVEKLETDFDRIENFVNENGKVKAGQVARVLNISPKLVEECARILEQNNLVKIDYPPVGDINIIAVGYVPKAEKKEEKPNGIKFPKINIFNKQKK